MLRLCPVMLVVVALIPTRVQLMCTDIMATTAQIATGHIMRSSFAASCPCRMIALLLASKLFFQTMNALPHGLMSTQRSVYTHAKAALI